MKNSIITKDFLASLIIERLRTAMPAAKAQYEDSKDRIGYFFVDDVLPDDIAAAIDKLYQVTEFQGHNQVFSILFFDKIHSNKSEGPPISARGLSARGQRPMILLA